MSTSEWSAAGDPIYHHGEPTGSGEPSSGDADLIEAVSAHVTRHLGPVKAVFHEIVSTDVHVDVHWVAPSEENPFHTLVTSGMAERPMTVPQEFEDQGAFAELVVFLPPEWPVGVDAFDREEHYWPCRWLKLMARFPHEYGTWLSFGHTMPNGDPPEPFAPGTELCCMMLVPPVEAPDGFHDGLVRRDGQPVLFWALLPLYREEMELKLREGAEALLERFERHDLTAVVDPRRPNVARKKRFGRF